MVALVQELIQYREVLYVLVMRRLKVRYKRTVLGFLWSLGSPFVLTLILWVVAKKLMHQPIPNLSAYILCTMFAWQYFNAAILDGCVAVSHHMPFVKAFYFPREILPLATVLGNLIHFLLSLIVLFIYFMVLPVYLTPKAWLLLVIILGQTILITGLVFILSYLNVYYHDVQFAIDQILRLLFFACPIFYFAEAVAQHGPRWFFLYMLNPLAVYFTMYKHVLLPPPQLPGTAPLSLDVLLPYFGLALLISVAILLVGLLMFQRHKWVLAEWL